MKAPGLTFVRGTQYCITKDAAVKLLGVTMIYWELVSQEFDLEGNARNAAEPNAALCRGLLALRLDLRTLNQ